MEGPTAGECCCQPARDLVRAGCRVTVLLPRDRDTPAAEVTEGIVVKPFFYFRPQRLRRGL